MAEPIALKLAPRDPREALYHRLENAPLEHVEALLAAYEVLQGLQDRGVLEMLRGALGSSDKVLQILVDAVNTPEAICGIRNFMILIRIALALKLARRRLFKGLPALNVRVASCNACFCDSLSASLLLLSRFRTKGPWSFETAALGVISACMNLYITACTILPDRSVGGGTPRKPQQPDYGDDQ